MGKSLHQLLCKTLLLSALIFQQSGFSAHSLEYNIAPVSGSITSPFGWRTDPITGSSRFHGGIDIATPMNRPVYTPQAGYVMFSGNYRGYGNVVVINHGNSLFTLYGHNAQLLVKAGDTVCRGQAISQVGSTGRSTGPHLHFEVHYNQQYLNPLTYLAYCQQAGMNQTLAQAPSRIRQPDAKANTPSNRKSVHRAVRTKSHHHPNALRYGENAVELLSGTDIETVEF